MKRLIIVYSSDSTRFSEVDKKVIEKSRKLKGWMVAKFEVQEIFASENIAKLARIIRKGDLVLSAGGDGTAMTAMNAIIKSGEIATLAVMPFGNFNDFAETLGKMSFERLIRKFEEGKYVDFYPLDIRVNGKHYTYSGVYFAMGMMAESADLMRQANIRRRLAKAKNRMVFSARKLFGWYMKNKWRKNLLPSDVRINDIAVEKNCTDYVALNGGSMAGVVPGGVWYRSGRQFWSGTMRNRSFWRMLRKFLLALEGELPGNESTGDKLTFKKPRKIYVCAEGEGEELENVSEISVSKTGKGLRVIKA